MKDYFSVLNLNRLYLIINGVLRMIRFIKKVAVFISNTAQDLGFHKKLSTLRYDELKFVIQKRIQSLHRTEEGYKHGCIGSTRKFEEWK